MEEINLVEQVKLAITGVATKASDEHNARVKKTKDVDELCGELRAQFLKLRQELQIPLHPQRPVAQYTDHFMINSTRSGVSREWITIHCGKDCPSGRMWIVRYPEKGTEWGEKDRAQLIIDIAVLIAVEFKKT